MSLPHFPSFSIARCTLRKLDEAEIVDIAFQKQKLEEWKVEHEKLDAEQDRELKTLKEQYQRLHRLYTKRNKALLKLRSEQRKFFEWLKSKTDSSGWLEIFVDEEFEEKKKVLLKE